MMSFSKQVRDELTREKEQLAEKIAQLEGRIEIAKKRHAAIEQILTTDKAVVQVSGFASKGIADAIRTVLGELGALKPQKVVRAMVAKDYPENGAETDLATRVRNQMWRMEKKGHLVKNTKGEYGLPEG